MRLDVMYLDGKIATYLDVTNFVIEENVLSFNSISLMGEKQNVLLAKHIIKAFKIELKGGAENE